MEERLGGESGMDQRGHCLRERLVALFMGALVGLLVVALRRRRAAPALPLSDVSLHLDGGA